MTTRWILGRWQRDLTFLFLPGFLSLLLINLVPLHANGVLGLTVLFFAKGFADSGHIYTTLWRTYFHSDELQSRKIYTWAPPVIFFACLGCLALNVPYFWSFVVYATLFHNFRQLYGINKWYRRINGIRRPAADLYLQILCAWPALCYHFREDPVPAHYYQKGELFLHASPGAWQAGLIIYALLLFTWIFTEVRAYLQTRRFEIVYLSNFILAIAMYGQGFIFGKTAEQIIIPLIVSHGIAYQALVALAMNKTQPEKHPLWPRALGFVALTALLFGGFEFAYENEWFNIQLPEAFDVLLTTVILTVLLCHYYFDMFLWRIKHRESALIYS